ncbi:MAG: nuclear transport factor 2 family protein [Pseudomonadota bacterium]
MTGAVIAADQPEPVHAATQIAISQTLTDIAAGADRHDWSRVRSAMADQITTDYTSLFGGEPVTQSSQDLVDAWANFLPGFDMTHHMVTNHTVTTRGEDTATAQADFTATHRLDDKIWVLGGRYSYELSETTRGWVVTSIEMLALWETGDRESLIQQASARVADKKP